MKEKHIWSGSDYLILALIPIEVLIGLFKPPFLAERPLLLSIVGFVVAVVIFITVLKVRGEFLKSEWALFKKHRVKNLLYVVLVIVAFAAFQEIVTKLVPGAVTLGPHDPGYRFAALLGFFVPLMAPFTEEVVFRYELFYKFANGGKMRLVLMAIVSAVLFGLAHYISGDNFASILALSLTGLALSGIYYITKNIWVTLIGHFIWNLIFALPILVVVFFNVQMGK